MKIMILLSCFLLGCATDNHSNKSPIQNALSGTIDIFGNEVKKLPISRIAPLDKFHLKSWLIKNYFNGKQIEVELSKESNSIMIFNVIIKDNVANNVPRNYSLIKTVNKNTYFLLPIDFNDIFEISSDLMIGGIYSYREYEYYFIYRLDSQVVKLIFDSRNFNKYGIKIGYYRDDDCFEYQPNRLVYRYDGGRSIFFDGTLKKFCKKGIDRDPKMKQPIDENKIRVRLDYTGEFWVYNENSKYEFW
jgi:hypothetical protein